MLIADIVLRLLSYVAQLWRERRLSTTLASQELGVSPNTFEKWLREINSFDIA